MNEWNFGDENEERCCRPRLKGKQRKCFKALRSFCSEPKSRPLAGRALCACALADRVLVDGETAVITAGL